MRFYESIIPVKRLELNMRAQEQAMIDGVEEGAVAPTTGRIWLEGKKERNRCTVISLTVSLISTTGSVIFWLIGDRQVF